MSKDGKDKAAQEPREIPIDGADEVTEGAAEAAAPAPEAEQVETAFRRNGTTIASARPKRLARCAFVPLKSSWAICFP